MQWYGGSLPSAVDGVVRRVRRGGEPSHVGYVLRPALLRDLDTALREHRPDVVHLFGWGTAGLVERVGGVPAVHDTVDPWAANLSNRSVGLMHRLLDAGELDRVRQHESRCYPQLARVLVRTDEDAAELQQQVPAAPVAVVLQGVDAGPEPLRREGSPTLAFLGAYDATSNVDAAAELVERVLPLVRQHHPDVRAALLGRDPTKRLRGLAGPQVTVPGYLPDVRSALASATVFVASMRSGRGVKNKVLEAMAAGLPVVATRLALNGIGTSVGVVAADTAEEQAAAVLQWLADPEARETAGRANRECVLTRHTWAASAAVVEAIWADACTSTS